MNYCNPEKLSDGRYYVKISDDVTMVEKNVKIGQIQDDMILTLSNVESIKNIDDAIIQDAVGHSKDWFQKEISRDILDNYYQSALEDNVLQVVAPKNPRGKFTIAMFTENKETLEKIEPGTICNVLLQLDGIWFLKKSFGPVWKIIQVRTKRQPKKIECMIHDDDSD